VSVRWDVARSQLDPEFGDDVHAMLAAQPDSWAVVQGKRDFAYQDKLYAQGRTTPGEIVTNAKGHQSAHCWGLAVDVAHLDADGKEHWDYEDPAWQRLEDAVNRHPRLHGGWTFPKPDLDHIQAVKWIALRTTLVHDGRWDA
jgi:hypothetical protein